MVPLGFAVADHIQISYAALYRRPPSRISLTLGGPGSLVGANYLPLLRTRRHLMSAENWIELIGGIALVIYLFVALTHPEWF